MLHKISTATGRRSFTNATRNLDSRTTLISLLTRNAAGHGSAIAIRERHLGIWREYSWLNYADEVCTFAAGLDDLGVSPGEPVAVIGDNRARLYFAMVAAAALGAYAVPLYPETPADELSQYIKPGMRFVIVEDQEQADKLMELRARLGLPLTIIYDDPRGVAGYRQDFLVAYDAIIARGAARIAAIPSLRAEIFSRAVPDGWAVLLHSSGTTGKPKGIPLKHRHLVAAVTQAAEAGYFVEEDRLMGYLPMAWVGDYTFSVAATIALRCTLHIPERQETAMHDIREAAPTMFFAAARGWDNLLTRLQVRIAESTPLKRALVNHFIGFATHLERKRLSGTAPRPLQRIWHRVGESLVYGPIKDHLGLARAGNCYTAGEAVGEDTFLYFRGLGINLKQFYGQSENCAISAAQQDLAVTLHTVGTALPGVDIRIGEAGEILIRSGSVFDGYADDADATAAALVDGWLRTGDAGYLQDDGQLVVLGRVSELQHTGSGQRFIPTYIENRLKFSSYIRDVAVMGAGRPNLTALVCIDMEAVGHWAQVQGVGYTSYADLSQNPKVLDLVRTVTRRTNGILPDGLKLHRFINLPKEFDPDDGEVTRTRKLRRNVIGERYASVIEALYSNAGAVDVDVPIVYETGEKGVLRRKLAIVDVGA